MKEYVKASVHNHFGGEHADKPLDAAFTDESSFCLAAACESIREASSEGYYLLAATNQNAIHTPEYYLMKEYAFRQGVTLLPGIEINLQNWNDESKYLHVVVIFDPISNLFEIQKVLFDSINLNQKNCLNIGQFIEMVTLGRCIIVAHGLKQNTRSSANNPELLSDLADLNEAIPVVLEDNKEYCRITLKERVQDYLSQEQVIWLDETAVISAADRKNFSKIESPTYLWGKASFNDLYYAAIMGGTRFFREDDLVSKVTYVSRIQIDASDQTQIHSSDISCSHGLNSIIGSSGSGKTLLLDVIKRKLTGKDLVNRTISKDAKYDELYEIDAVRLFGKDGEVIDQNSGYVVIEGENLYSKVIEAYSSDKSKLLKELGLEIDNNDWQTIISSFNRKLNQYIEEQKKIGSNKAEVTALIKSIESAEKFLNENKSSKSEALRFVKDSKLDTVDEQCSKKLAAINSDAKTLKKNFQSITDVISRNQLETSLKTDLEDLHERIAQQLSKKEIETKKEKARNKQKLIIHDKLYKTTQIYNKKVGEKTAHIVERQQIVSSGFQSILSLLLSTVQISIKSSVPVLDEETLSSSVKYSENNIADIAVNDVKTVMENTEELRKAFPLNIGNTPKINKSKFEKGLYDFCSADDVLEFAQVFIENNYSDDVHFSFPFTEMIDYEIRLKNLQGDFESIDKITAGMLGKIYINHFLDQQLEDAGSNIIILFDQPDANMEKAFILEHLAPKLMELRKQFQVFITTHEPLLVVNSDSNSIIRATNDKTVGQNNCITYENYSFVGVGGKQEMIDEIAKLIDGSTQAISKRHTIYRGMKNG